LRALLAAVVAVIAVILAVVFDVGPDAGSDTTQARGLSCGSFTFPECDGPDQQFDPAFSATEGAGGFGGGQCAITRTPVVFVHGNADRSINWDSDITGPVGDRPPPAQSVYDEFVSRGYNGCELFGITFLTDAEQRSPQLNYHQPEKFRMIVDFIEKVKATTGAPRVDIVAHSLGVSMTLAALTWHDETTVEKNAWGSVRRLVNIAGGLHGLGACRLVGFANPLVSTCGSQNLLDPYVFGFSQDNGSGLGRNDWTAASGEHSMRMMPTRHPDIDFYTIAAGAHDQVHCGRGADEAGDCSRGAMFEPATNVRAQLDVGAGETANKADLDMTDGSLFATRGGDVDGVGHYKTKNNTGAISYQMLNSECADIACQGTYAGGPVTAG
jgi:pimeloyl-ACP methyl ester carboxylesterase